MNQKNMKEDGKNFQDNLKGIGDLHDKHSIEIPAVTIKMRDANSNTATETNVGGIPNVPVIGCPDRSTDVERENSAKNRTVDSNLDMDPGSYRFDVEEEVEANPAICDGYLDESRIMETESSAKHGTLAVSVHSGNGDLSNTSVSSTNSATSDSLPELPKEPVSPAPKSIVKSMSAICINIDQVLNGDSAAGDHAATVTAKIVDFNTDEVERELANVMVNDDGLSTISDYPRGRAAATNTPVESHLCSRSLYTPVRDNIYDHALHLIKNRCSSGTTAVSSQFPHKHPSRGAEGDPVTGEGLVDLPTLLSKINEPPLVSQPNRTFFISQRRPIPLEPLQVWKGYHGNVFFQPLLCHRMRLSQQQKVSIDGADRTSRHQERRKHRKNSRFPHLDRRAATAKTWNGQSNLNSADPRTVASALFRPGTRQMSVLDRQTVMSQLDHHAGEDMRWLDGREALGTLKGGTGRARSSAHFYDNREKHYKLRICRGLVSHKDRGTTRGELELEASGDRMKDSPRTDGRAKATEQIVSLQRMGQSSSLEDGRDRLGSGGKHVIVDLTTFSGRLDHSKVK